MMRWLAAAGAAVLLIIAAVSFLSADRGRAALPAPPPEAERAETAALPAPIEAKAAPTPQQREARRLARYDRDKNGAVSVEEYLRSRQRAFAKLDTDGDGKMSFAEYSAKSAAKFDGADKDKSRTLSAVEFAATAVVRKPARAAAPCPPTAEADD